MVDLNLYRLSLKASATQYITYRLCTADGPIKAVSVYNGNYYPRQVHQILVRFTPPHNTVTSFHGTMCANSWGLHWFYEERALEVVASVSSRFPMDGSTLLECVFGWRSWTWPIGVRVHGARHRSTVCEHSPFSLWEVRWRNLSRYWMNPTVSRFVIEYLITFTHS